MRVAAGCRLDQIGNVLPNDRRARADQLLGNAKHNHQQMLPHAARVHATVVALRPIISPDYFGIRISRALAIRMLVVLGPLIAKKEEKKTLLENCAEMLAPGMDIIGQATGLWHRVSKHPVVLALALQKLKNVKVFASQAELREAMQEAERSIQSLVSSADNWLELLFDSDRIVFERDRAVWQLAYNHVGSDVVSVMQDFEEGGDGEDSPPAPRWAAQEELRQAKLQIEKPRRPAVGN